MARRALPKDKPKNSHLGEDWSGKGLGDTDLGDPVNCIAHGKVIFAEDAHMGWGKTIIIRHAYADADGSVKQIESLYTHLGELGVEFGDIVQRGDQIGTVGSNDGMYLAHLHFEIRKRLGIGLNRTQFPRDLTSYHRPSDFIEAHRPGRQ